MKIFILLLVFVVVVDGSRIDMRFFGPNSTEHFYAIRGGGDSVQRCSKGSYASKHLIRTYKSMGAHDFERNYRYVPIGRYESTIPDGYSSIFVRVLPHNISLSLYFTGYVETCLIANGYVKSHRDDNKDWVYTNPNSTYQRCLSEDDVVMIGNLSLTSQPLKDDCSDFETGAIVIASFGGGILVIFVIASIFIYHKRTTSSHASHIAERDEV